MAGQQRDDEHARVRKRLMSERMARQIALLERLQCEARDAADASLRCVGWLTTERHAHRILRSLDETAAVRPDGENQALAHHRDVVHGFWEEAKEQVAGSDRQLLDRATAALGLRLAVTGKGGAGKTLVAATLARLLARRGHKVLAVDLDPNPGLAFGLGMPVTNAGLPAEAVRQDDHGGWLATLAPGLSPVEAVQRYATPGPDGVRYLGLGKITDPERHGMRTSLAPLFQILSELADSDWHVIGDFEAGTSTPFQRYHLFFADRALVVVGPSWASALTAQRLQDLLRAVPAVVVANGFRGQPDHHLLAPSARVPFDPAIAEADRLGLAPLDHCPNSPAVHAIGELVELLTNQEVVR